MEKVEAWQSVDGMLFLDKDDAIKHEEKNKGKHERDIILANKDEWIKEYIFTNLKDDLRDDEITEKEIGWSCDTKHGWDCDGVDNPVDKCVYSYDLFYGDDGCVFCGQPEERK